MVHIRHVGLGLDGASTTARLLREFPWEGTPLGRIEGWPRALRTTVDQMLISPMPHFIAWGPALQMLYNDAYLSIAGDKHPASLAKPLPESWSEAWPSIESHFDHALAGGTVSMEDMEFQILRDGHLQARYFTFWYAPLADDAGEIQGVFCSVIETTAKVAAERAVRDQAERQRRLFQQAPGFICILQGPDHVFEFVNDAHIRLFNSRGWIGRPVRDAFPDIAGQGFYELLDSVYTTGERVVIFDAPARYRDAEGRETLRYLDFIYAPVIDESGSVTGIFCEGHDVTEAHDAREVRERQHEKLEVLAASLANANRRQTEFLATLAHELRNPLAPIRNALAVIKLTDAASPQSRLHEVIDRQVGIMVRLIDDLLDVARVTRGKIELETEPADLRSVLAGAVETSVPLIEQRSHHLQLEVAAEPLPANIDCVRIAQVVSNLLNNAAKYTPPGGRIRLAAAAEGESVRIDVSDTGVGISKAALESVFEMFTQVDGSGTSGAGGLGIGLALVKQLVELHGGRVEACSPGPGRGSTFSVWLPRSEELQLRERAPEAATDGGATVARRVVVVDDNRDAADTLAALLVAAGHRVLTAYDGESALQALLSQRPDVAFIDIGMPGLGGREVASAVRSDLTVSRTTLVAVTGWGTAKDREMTTAAGFDFHLTKPASPDDVQLIMSRLP